MSQLKLIIVFVIILLGVPSKILHSQEPYIDMGFVIILSTKDYSSALKVAKEASSKLDWKLNLRNYYEDKVNGGLKTDIKCGCGIEHSVSYITRGRDETGNYVSIEFSNAFEEFTKGYYIVVVSSGYKEDKFLSESLNMAKEFYPDAYRKISNVYLGCMH